LGEQDPLSIAAPPLPGKKIRGFKTPYFLDFEIPPFRFLFYHLTMAKLPNSIINIRNYRIYLSSLIIK